MNLSILEKSPAVIAAEYRARQIYVWTLPPGERWKYGAELRTLKAVHIVAREAQQVRRL